MHKFARGLENPITHEERERDWWVVSRIVDTDGYVSLTVATSCGRMWPALGRRWEAVTPTAGILIRQVPHHF
jgi:hypothetical protein